MKERLDVLLVKRGLAQSREKAKAIIMTGNVFVKNQREDKAGSMFPPDVAIEVKGTQMKYVSRGGYKLEKAMDLWQVPLEGKICMDVGSSTGGFTDCMLQNGAKKVFAIDVGYGQLAWKLRVDERVINMERTNIRNVTLADIGTEIDFASIDVAFISLAKVLPVAYELLKNNGEVIALIKPQFEAGKEFVGKKGVVRDPEVHESVITKVTNLAAELGFTALGLTYSPVKGPEGNIEYLIWLTKEQEKPQNVNEEIIKAVVAAAHSELDK